jgi:hypothetical protein
MCASLLAQFIFLSGILFECMCLTAEVLGRRGSSLHSDGVRNVLSCVSQKQTENGKVIKIQGKVKQKLIYLNNYVGYSEKYRLYNSMSLHSFAPSLFLLSLSSSDTGAVNMALLLTESTKEGQ